MIAEVVAYFSFVKCDLLRIHSSASGEARSARFTDLMRLGSMLSPGAVIVSDYCTSPSGGGACLTESETWDQLVRGKMVDQVECRQGAGDGRGYCSGVFNGSS